MILKEKFLSSLLGIGNYSFKYFRSWWISKVCVFNKVIINIFIKMISNCKKFIIG